MKVEEKPKMKKADEKICADCQVRECGTGLCLNFGRKGALKVRRTDMACNYFQGKQGVHCLLIVVCFLAFIQFSFPYLLNFSGVR